MQGGDDIRPGAKAGAGHARHGLIDPQVKEGHSIEAELRSKLPGFEHQFVAGFDAHDLRARRE